MFGHIRPQPRTGRSFAYTPPCDDITSLMLAHRDSSEVTSYFSTTLRARNSSPKYLPAQRRLTTVLLASALTEYQAATQHPFLRAAGQGLVSKQELGRWLSQDRLYVETYISFIGSLLARVTLPYAFVTNKSISLRWRMINLLTTTLLNKQQELDFFTNVAAEYNVILEEPWVKGSTTFEPDIVTGQYLNLFTSFHLDPVQTLLEGFLVLWATEKCCLDAWTYAASELQAKSSDDADGGALRNELIPNWSSHEFAKFVDDIAEVLDDLAERQGALRKIESYRALWLYVLEIEKGFWPDVATE